MSFDWGVYLDDKISDDTQFIFWWFGRRGAQTYNKIGYLSVINELGEVMYNISDVSAIRMQVTYPHFDLDAKCKERYDGVGILLQHGLTSVVNALILHERPKEIKIESTSTHPQW